MQEVQIMSALALLVVSIVHVRHREGRESKSRHLMTHLHPPPPLVFMSVRIVHGEPSPDMLWT